MGHRDYKTTSIYADYAPDPSQGATYAKRAFANEPTGNRDSHAGDLPINARAQMAGLTDA